MTFYTMITFTDAFRNLIKAHRYEEYVLSIINKSAKIFRGNAFKSVREQSHGECDFIDKQGKKYDAKLLFNEEQGRLIGDNSNDLQQWLQEMMDERAEFAESIEKRDLSYVEQTKLYSIIRERLGSIQEDENAIFFIPFPVVVDFEGAVIAQLATDFLQAVFDRLKDNGNVGKRRVFFIYPSMESHIYVLRNENRVREFIFCPELKDFITFSTTTTKDR